MNERHDVGDEEWPERIENDPRWEVPPKLDDEDEGGSSGRAAVFAALLIAALVAVLAWMVISTPTAV